VRGLTSVFCLVSGLGRLVLCCFVQTCCVHITGCLVQSLDCSNLSLLMLKTKHLSIIARTMSSWVKSLEQSNGLRAVAASSPALLPTLEAAVRAGLPVLVENVGEALDPVLDPLLMKAVYKHGAGWGSGLEASVLKQSAATLH